MNTSLHADRARVFLDTTVLKLAADRVIRGFTRQKTVMWGEDRATIPLVQFRTVWLPAKPGAQAEDAALLPILAHLAIQNRIELLWHLDGALEFAGLPKTDSPQGRLFGAPITWAKDPGPWGRTIAGAGKSMKEHQLDFLRSHRDPRFLALQVAVGVKAGSNHADNQLLDAWHLWCAERAEADYFLTCDYKLIRHLDGHRRTQPNVSVVTPRQLLADLVQSRRVGVLDILRALGTELWLRFRRTPRMGLEGLAALGDDLEARNFYD